ncbi:MAG: 1,4-alpha-glucan branching enzyme [Thermosediminibacterales bacterium]|nr:1,4-alpha-glucan branching enzyme [Thermosediminibacterales bacterium]
MINLEKGYVSLVLHAHLPYVRHPEHEFFLEEKWYYEAVTETYIPLIKVFDALIREDVDFRITMTLTPTLVSLMSDELIQKRYQRYLEKLIELSEKEVERTRSHQPEFHDTAKVYRSLFTEVYQIYTDYCRGNLVGAFKRFQDSGHLEIITSAATHGFLPHMVQVPEAVRAQIKVGIDSYIKHFGRRPRGFWLPECAYTSELDEFLKKEGISYYILETHGVLFADPKPKYATFAPILSPGGVAAFGRDIESSKQVWSATEGYPGDYEYREFYRDIGHDLDFDYIKPYIHPDGIRIQTGIKYYKITGKVDLKDKQPYNYKRAISKAEEHAGNFMFNREHQIRYASGGMDKPPIVLCPYDAELFGHWWFEGPKWLEFLFRKASKDQNTFKFITPSEYLDKYPRIQICSPNPSSWGNKGYFEVWLNKNNDWIYRHLHQAVRKMVELTERFTDARGLRRDALNQAARELLLAQSSDWAFIMDSGTMVEYAVKRTKDHIYRFNKLYEDIVNNKIDENWLRNITYLDNIFPDIDYRVYQKKS